MASLTYVPSLESRAHFQVREASSPFFPFAVDQIEQSIAARFEQQVQMHGHRAAVTTPTDEWTYAELNRFANRIARAVLAVRGTGSESVILYLEKGPAFLAAMLGVLKAGKCYVPLAISNPPRQNRQFAADARATLIVTDRQHRAAANQFADAAADILEVDDVDAYADQNLDLTIAPDALAYILYTSGSTGAPKGVYDNQRNILVNVRNYTNSHAITPDDRFVCVHPWAFSGSLKCIYGALLNGATLVALDLEHVPLTDLADWLIRADVTILNVVVTVYRHFIQTLNGDEQFPRLRLVRLGSEGVLRTDVEACRRHFSPDCVFANGYGGTEVGTTGLYVVGPTDPLPERAVPIGYGVEGKDLLLLDEDDQPVPSGRIGQIAIRSQYLALGYWQRPDLTAASFRPDPHGRQSRVYLTGDLGVRMADGCVVFAGRKDFQVKVRGHRVEVAAVELALLEAPEVQEAAVLAHEDQPADHPLVGYVVLRPGQSRHSVSVELRRFLRERLPEYAVPSQFVLLDALPLTSSGKLDRKALPAPTQDRPEQGAGFVGPRNEVETCLVRIWEEVLDTSPVGVRDSFFDIGGDSLLAVRMFERIRREFGKQLRLAELFEGSTIEHLARAVAGQTAPARYSTLVPIQPRGSKPAFYCVHAAGGEVLCLERLAHFLGDDQPFFGFQPLRSAGAAPLQRVEDMAACYLEELLDRQPCGPYYLGGWSFGALVAYEMAQRLRLLGHEVALLVNIDQRNPNLNRPWSFSPSTAMRFLRNFSSSVAHQLAQEDWGTVIRRQLAKIPGLRKWLDRFGGEKLTPPNARNEAPLPEDDYQILMANYAAKDAYTPQTYPGRVTLFRARTQLRWRWEEFGLGWTGLAADGVDVHEVPGDHYSIVAEPHVSGLAPQLQKVLAQAFEQYEMCRQN